MRAAHNNEVSNTVSLPLTRPSSSPPLGSKASTIFPPSLLDTYRAALCCEHSSRPKLFVLAS